MKKQGLNKAKDDLNEARKALLELNSAKSLDEAEGAWLRFVEKFGRFFNKLAASAKGNSHSEGWLGKITNERTSDEALSYLMQARNALEHTIEDIAEKRPGSFSIGGGDWVYIEHLTINAGVIEGKIHGSPGTKITNEAPALRLLPITNRGKNYPVPLTHMGQLIDATPASLGALAISYAAKILIEAEGKALIK